MRELQSAVLEAFSERSLQDPRIGALEDALREADIAARQDHIIIGALRALVRGYRAEATAAPAQLRDNADEADDVPMLDAGTPTEPLPGAVPSPTDVASDGEGTPTPSSSYQEQLAAAAAAAEAEPEPWNAALIAARFPGTPPPGFQILTIIQMDGSHTHHLIQLTGSNASERDRSLLQLVR